MSSAKTVMLCLFRDSYENSVEFDGDAWALYDFKGETRGGYQRVVKSVRTNIVSKEMLAKIDTGLAFNLKLCEGWNVEWMVNADSKDGLLVWEHAEEALGAKTIINRQKNAAQCLKSWTNWYNGNVYGFTLENDKGDLLANDAGQFGGGSMFNDHLHPELRSYAKSLGLVHFEAVPRMSYFPGIHNAEDTLYVLYTGEDYVVESLSDQFSFIPYKGDKS